MESLENKKIIRVCYCHEEEVETALDNSGLDHYCKITGEPVDTFIREVSNK